MRWRRPRRPSLSQPISSAARREAPPEDSGTRKRACSASFTGRSSPWCHASSSAQGPDHAPPLTTAVAVQPYAASAAGADLTRAARARRERKPVDPADDVGNRRIVSAVSRNGYYGLRPLVKRRTAPTRLAPRPRSRSHAERATEKSRSPRAGGRYCCDPERHRGAGIQEIAQPVVPRDHLLEVIQTRSRRLSTDVDQAVAQRSVPCRAARAPAMLPD